MCAKAYLKKDLFSDYRLNTHMIRAAAAAQGAQAAAAASVDYTCHLSLNCLIDSLMILGSGQKDTLKDLQSCVLHLEIQAHNHPLIVMYETDAHAAACGARVLFPHASLLCFLCVSVPLPWLSLDGDAGGYHNVTTAEIQMREQEGLDSNDGFHIGKDKLLLAVVNVRHTHQLPQRAQRPPAHGKPFSSLFSHPFFVALVVFLLCVAGHSVPSRVL